jgi:hypothetical protein
VYALAVEAASKQARRIILNIGSPHNSGNAKRVRPPGVCHGYNPRRVIET